MSRLDYFSGWWTLLSRVFIWFGRVFGVECDTCGLFMAPVGWGFGPDGARGWVVGCKRAGWLGASGWVARCKRLGR